ncbi:MAG: PorV/PorQ family protein [Bacteroidota bacterium]
MNRNYRIPIFIIVMFALLLSSGKIDAQSIARVGTTAAAFLKIGVGARALGMGEAYTTLAEDITGMYWNPAGISRIEKMQAVINHFDYIADLFYDYGGFAMPIENIGTFGAFIARLGMPDIERTTIQSPNGTGEKVSASSFVIGLSYARALTDRFSIGGNVKYVSESIWHSSASSIAFDVGVLYRAFFKNIRIGMSISNFGSEMQMSGRDMLVQHDINPIFEGNNRNINSYLDTDKFPLPILFRVGISANVTKDFFDVSEHDFIISVDAINPNDNKQFFNIGTEIKLFNRFSLRGGYRQFLLQDREGGLTLGFGVQLNVMNIDLNLDYANVDYGRLDNQNKFSLILSF